MKTAHITTTQRWLPALSALWLLSLVFGPALIGFLGLNLNPHGHTHLYAHGHPFVDARTLWGIPNAMDVLSNLPMALAGFWGWRLLADGRHLPTATARAARVFFIGLVLTGIGSTVYHWAPDASSLVLDRLGMAVSFAGALSLALAERAGQVAARAALGWVLAAALLSAVLPAANDNTLPWAVVQFGGLALIVRLALLPAAEGAVGVRLGGVIGLYALAKALELGDEVVFQATTGQLSGHSLKHLAAALAAWPVIVAVTNRGLRQNAAARVA